MMAIIIKFFSHVKLVAQYYVCEWNKKLVNKLYIVLTRYSVLTVRPRLRSSTTEDTTIASGQNSSPE